MNLAAIDHVRKRLDLTRPVEPEIIQQCIDIALQAPVGGGKSPYHFMVVIDPAKRASIAALYKKAFDEYMSVKSPGSSGFSIYDSAAYLSDHLHEVPVHIIACIEGSTENVDSFERAKEYGSILPAAWSLMLALRSRGLGAAWTTLHLKYEAEVASILGMPDDLTQGVLLPVAYFTGDGFKPAKRLPGRERTYWDTWGNTR